MLVRANSAAWKQGSGLARRMGAQKLKIETFTNLDQLTKKIDADAPRIYTLLLTERYNAK